MIQIAPEFEKIDAGMTRWARERRDTDPKLLCAIAAMMARKEGVVFDGPLVMSELSVAIEGIYSSPTIPEQEKSVVTLSYVRAMPARQIESRLHINRTRFYDLRKVALAYFRGRLHEIGFGAV